MSEPLTADNPPQPPPYKPPITTAVRRQAIGSVFLLFCISLLYTFWFFWLGSTLIGADHQVQVPLSLPSWSQVRVWTGRPDTAWYLNIIQQGYQRGPFSLERQANWAFFPAYPLLIRGLAPASDVETIEVTGWLVSLLLYLFSLFFLWFLLALDFDRDIVFRTLILFCFYPFAYTWTLVGPDSLALFTTAASLYFARKQKWILSGLAAGVASGTRVQGVLLVPCLAYLYFRGKGHQWRKPDRGWVALGLAPTGLVAFSAYLWHLTGNPLAFSDIQATWDNSVSYPFRSLVQFVQEPHIIGHYGWDPEVLSFVFTLSILPIVIWGWTSKRMPMEYNILMSLLLLVLVCRSSSLGNPRYIGAMFPYFLTLAIWGKNEKVFALALVLFAGLFGLFASLFAAGANSVYRFAAF